MVFHGWKNIYFVITFEQELRYKILDSYLFSLSTLWVPLHYLLPSMAMAWMSSWGLVFAHLYVICVSSLTLFEIIFLSLISCQYGFIFIYQRHYCSENAHLFHFEMIRKILFQIFLLCQFLHYLLCGFLLDKYWRLSFLFLFILAVLIF